jgi:hypothetical protein
MNLHSKREDLVPLKRDCNPASGGASLFARTFSILPGPFFLWKNYRLGRLQKAFGRIENLFVKKRFPETTALNACFYKHWHTEDTCTKKY